MIMNKGKIIILSAPSGTGKSTIIAKLMEQPDICLGFSVSATSRQPRGNEVHGKDYYFLSPEEFDQKIANGEFVEWEEVYAGTKYGTLRSEVENVINSGCNLIMDIDVKGALSVKKIFGKDATSIFVVPPSLEVLEHRLRSRATDSEESISKRLHKAEFELEFAPKFDYKVVNDSLEHAVEEIRQIILM